MSLEQQLGEMLKQAMKDKDTQTLGAVRMLKTKIMERRTSKGFTGTVDDALITEVIAAYRKQLIKAIAEFAGHERGQDLPRRGELGSLIDGGERVAPPHERALRATDHEGELAARFGGDDFGAGLPRTLGLLVAAGEPGAYSRRVAVVPPTRLADRTPLPHARHVGDKVVQLRRRTSDDDRIRMAERVGHRARLCSGAAKCSEKQALIAEAGS